MQHKEFISLIEKAHEGQFYKGEVPYKFHLHRVAHLVLYLLKKNNELIEEDRICKAALAHDALEDTKITEEQLREFCDEKTISWIKALTSHQKNSPRPEYIQKLVSADEEVWLIKLADLFDNMQTGTRRIKENRVEWTKNWFLPVIEEQFTALKSVNFKKFPKTGRGLQDWCDYSMNVLKEEIMQWQR